MIRFTNINVVTNSDAYIYSYLNVDMSKDQQRFVLNLRVEDLNTSYIALATVGKGSNKKTAKRKLEILG